MPPTLLLTVTDSLRVPGLGVLAWGQADAPLLPFALHAALSVVVAFADGRRAAVTATVEEVGHADTTRRGLLLEFLTPTSLPPGTRLLAAEPARWAAGAVPDQEG